MANCEGHILQEVADLEKVLWRPVQHGVNSPEACLLEQEKQE